MSEDNGRANDPGGPASNQVQSSRTRRNGNDGSLKDASPAGTGKVGGLRDWITAIASVITVVIALTAVVFSNPADFREWVRVQGGSYNVHVDSPRGGDVQGGIRISGTANIPPDWSLVVLTQNPDEFTYYMATSGAIPIGLNHHWNAGYVPLGRSDPKQRINDIHKPYRIYALIVDDQGQRTIQQAVILANKNHSSTTTLSTLPHHTCAAVVVVNLVK